MKFVRTVSLLGFWLVFGNLIATNAFPQVTRFLGSGLSSSSSVETTTTRPRQSPAIYRLPPTQVCLRRMRVITLQPA
jgi:hypothetical protein